MNSSLSSKDISVTRYRPIICTSVCKSNSSLPVVNDKYSFTRTRNTFASLITSIESLEPLSWWFLLLNNGKGSLYGSLRLENCVFCLR